MKDHCVPNRVGAKNKERLQQYWAFERATNHQAATSKI